MICTHTTPFHCLKNVLQKKLILIFLVLVFIFCVREGAILSPDSNTYINHAPIRMGLYPLFISLFQYLFKGAALKALVSFQLIFTIATSYLLATFLQSTFKLPSLLHWILISLFLSPLVIFQCGNEILSEGLAYPLFLLTSNFFFKGILQRNMTDLYVFTFTLFLLAFTRQQYLIYYVAAFIAILYFVCFRLNFQKKGQFLLALTLSISSFFIAERTYHYAYHNSFSGTPFTGIEILIRPLFLATEDSYKNLDDPKQRLFVKEAVQSLLDQNLMDPDPNKRELNSFALNSNAMRYKISVPLLKKLWSEDTLNEEMDKTHSEFEFLQLIDKQAVSISLALIKNNFISYLKSYVKDVFRGFGGYAYFAFVFFASLLFFWNLVSNTASNTFYLTFIFSGLIHLGNLMIIAPFEPPILRYTYSTGALLFSMLLIMAFLFTRKPQLSKTDALCAV